MKYWNKDKDIRQRDWTPVPRPDIFHYAYKELKRQIQLMPGDGKFYFYYGSGTIWFEREEDAMWFILRWA